VGVAAALARQPCYVWSTIMSESSIQHEAVTLMDDGVLLEASECRGGKACEMEIQAFDLEADGGTAAAREAGRQKWVDLTRDDFEDGWGSFVSYGKGAYLCRVEECIEEGGNYVSSGEVAVRIQDDREKQSSFGLIRSYDVRSCAKLRVRFSYCVHGLERGEGFQLQYHDGTKWLDTRLWMRPNGKETLMTSGQAPRNIRSIENGDCDDESVVLKPPLKFPAYAKIRLMCQASSNHDRVYIDDVVFSCLL